MSRLSSTIAYDPALGVGIESIASPSALPSAFAIMGREADDAPIIVPLPLHPPCCRRQATGWPARKPLTDTKTFVSMEESPRCTIADPRRRAAFGDTGVLLRRASAATTSPSLLEGPSERSTARQRGLVTGSGYWPRYELLGR